MPSYGSDTGDVLYLIVCACPPTRDTAALVRALQRLGWDVCVAVTSHALDWIDRDHLEAVSGHPVRDRFSRPDETNGVPRGDAVLVAPASFNTINKWANGINGSLALGFLNEALGRSSPIWIVPWANEALTAHPAYRPNLDRLTTAGVQVLDPGASAFVDYLSGRMPGPERAG